MYVLLLYGNFYKIFCNSQQFFLILLFIEFLFAVLPLIIADQIDEIKQLLGKNKNLVNSFKYGSQKRTLLHKASQVGNLRVCKLLLDYDADVNEQDIKRQTPLWIAAKEGYGDICNELIQRGANVNKEDYIGRTPYFIAFKKRHKNVCKILDHNGANTELNDICFEKPFSECLCYYTSLLWENEHGKLLKHFT